MGFARDLLASDRLRSRGYLDPRATGKLLDSQEQATQAALAIWSLMIHELWLDQFTGTPARRSPFGARA